LRLRRAKMIVDEPTIDKVAVVEATACRAASCPEVRPILLIFNYVKTYVKVTKCDLYPVKCRLLTEKIM